MSAAALLRCAWEPEGARISLAVRAPDGHGFTLSMAPRAAASLVVNGQGAIDTVSEVFDAESYISAELTLNSPTNGQKEGGAA